KTLPVHFTATFSEPVNALAANGTGVVLGGTATHTSATIAVTTTDSSHYDIAVSGLTGNGTITAALNAAATTDLAGNNNLASTSTDNTVTYDTTAPTLSSINRAGTNPTKTGPLAFTVTFSEPVNNVAAGNFTIAASGTGGTAPTISSA